MKWLSLFLYKFKIFFWKIMEKFIQLGQGAVSKYPNLLSVLELKFDAQLNGYVINAYVLVDRKGRKQIHIQTTAGWEILEYSTNIISELSEFLGKEIAEVDLNTVAEMNLTLQDSLENISKQASASLLSAIKKIKM